MTDSKRVFGTILVGVLSLTVLQYEDIQKRRIICDRFLWEDIEHDEFEGFNNDTGVQGNRYIVPNYVHFLRMGKSLKEVTFIDAMVLLAAFKKQRPEKIFFHTDLESFTGEHWDYLMNDVKGFRDIIVLIKTELPKTIFNQTFTKENHYYHSSDVLRIRILMKYGGIFLDNDSFLVRSLDPYRKFEMVLEWDEGVYLGTQVLVAHRRARFLRLWLESYKDHYQPDFWYYNAGVRPTTIILYSRPELVHRVKLLFGVQDFRRIIYVNVWKHWRDQYAVHLLTRHLHRVLQSCDIYDYRNPRDLNETFVRKYPNTLREMISDIYKFNPNIHVEPVEKINCRS